MGTKDCPPMGQSRPVAGLLNSALGVESLLRVIPVSAWLFVGVSVAMESPKIDRFSVLRDPPWQLAIVFLVVLLSRLPFLDAGYGVNVDAWRVALRAVEIAITGDYSVSRFPGYPIQEIVCSWFWRGGPFALNALS